MAYSEKKASALELIKDENINYYLFKQKGIKFVITTLMHIYPLQWLEKNIGNDKMKLKGVHMKKKIVYSKDFKLQV